MVSSRIPSIPPPILLLLLVISRNLANIITPLVPTSSQSFSLVISGRAKFHPRTRDIHPPGQPKERTNSFSSFSPNTQCQCHRYTLFDVRETGFARRISEDCIGKEGWRRASKCERQMGPNKTAERSSNKSPTPSENVAPRKPPLALLPSFRLGRRRLRCRRRL